MRVHLDTQITSLSTCRMIDETISEEFSKEDLAPMRKTLFALDQLIDIINATSEPNGAKKDSEKINSPRHRHISELFQTLALFSDWKLEAGKFKERFIKQEGYEDLTWMIMAVASVTFKFLKDDKSFVFDQGRSRSDCCEHHFGNICMKYNSANTQHCEHGTAKANTARSCFFSIQSRTNKSGTRKEKQAELFEPMYQKGKGEIK